MSDSVAFSNEFCSRRLKAVADPIRWAVMAQLVAGSKNVTELNAALKADPTLLSHHLKILRDEGLVVGERQGKTIRYRVNPEVALRPSGRGIDLGCCRLELNGETPSIEDGEEAQEEPCSASDAVKEHYASVLEDARHLNARVCAGRQAIPPSVREILADIDDDILERSYGCGAPIPPYLDGCTVLDLGCGAGRDAYLASRLVGPKGSVIGVDMSEDLLDVARRHQTAQAQRFGYAKSNVDFRCGYAEDLAALAIADNAVDVVIANCLINLSPLKPTLFAEILRVLRPGGELCLSTVFAGRRMPREAGEDPVLMGECLGGAMYIEDFRRLLHELGCLDYRVMAKSPIVIDDPDIKTRVGMVDLYWMTVRAFKLSSLEDVREDYGQVACYLGTIADCPQRFQFDDHHLFVTGKPMLVCGNTAAMLAETRFSKHFKVMGDRLVHYGPFDRSPPSAAKAAEASG
jgi:SAM-dependent methyltransferase/DNA-binding transcriptional ArsR family regulator